MLEWSKLGLEIVAKTSAASREARLMADTCGLNQNPGGRASSYKPCGILNTEFKIKSMLCYMVSKFRWPIMSKIIYETRCLPVCRSPFVYCIQPCFDILQQFSINFWRLQQAKYLVDYWRFSENKAYNSTPVQASRFHENMKQVSTKPKKVTFKGRETSCTAQWAALSPSTKNSPEMTLHITYRSWTCDLCGPLLASSKEICSSSDCVKLSVEKFSSTTVQSPSTIELVSVKSVAEPILHSSPVGI